MTKNVTSLDSLIKGIEKLLLENRYSFSEEDVALLNQCLSLLKKAKKNQDVTFLVNALKILSAVFDVGDQFKDLF